MPRKEYAFQLDDEGLEWIRVRLTTAHGRLTQFAVQYETIIDGQLCPVVRFDNAHGYAHRDLLNRQGRIKQKDAMPGNPTLAEALTQGRNDIVRNWPRYRREYFGGE
jgi:hypothetical protein